MDLDLTDQTVPSYTDPVYVYWKENSLPKVIDKCHSGGGSN